MAENREGLLCGLEMMLYPRTVPCKGMAEPVRLASECQARERGSPHHLGDYRRLCRSQSECLINGLRLRDKGPSACSRNLLCNMCQPLTLIIGTDAIL